MKISVDPYYQRKNKAQCLQFLEIQSVERMRILAGVTLTVRLSTTVGLIFGHDLGGYTGTLQFACCMSTCREENNIIDDIQLTIVNSYC